MTWNTQDPKFKAIAEEHCTPEQLKALKVYAQVGYRRTGVILGISESSARGRINRALDRVHRVMEANEHRPDPLREPDSEAHEGQA